MGLDIISLHPVSLSEIIFMFIFFSKGISGCSLTNSAPDWFQSQSGSRQNFLVLPGHLLCCILFFFRFLKDTGHLNLWLFYVCAYFDMDSDKSP